MLAPDGVTAAIVGDLKDRGRAIEDRCMALDVKRKDRRADYDDEVMVAQRV